MLGLKLSTDPRWVKLADKEIEEILTDHAYCEQKAASTGISLIVKFPDLEDLVEQVSAVVEEEWGHFQMVLEELKKRNLKLGFQRKDLYVHELNQRIKNNGKRDEILLDKLLQLALIEARSCERFKLLSLECSDMELRKFYKRLMISEAGHYTLFIDLATTLLGKEVVKPRWEWFLEQEALIISNLEVKGERVH